MLYNGRSLPALVPGSTNVANNSLSIVIFIKKYLEKPLKHVLVSYVYIYFFSIGSYEWIVSMRSGQSRRNTAEIGMGVGRECAIREICPIPWIFVKGTKIEEKNKLSKIKIT
jgi:hypothetical protein